MSETLIRLEFILFSMDCIIHIIYYLIEIENIINKQF